MPYVLSLEDAWAKLERAHAHVEHLRVEVKKRWRAEFKMVIPLVRQLDAEQGAVVYRVDPHLEIPKDWPLVVGDALHNFRASLDYLAWQLALKRFEGHNPPQSLIRHIVFPILSSSDKWPGRVKDWAASEDMDGIRYFMPFELKTGSQAHELTALESLARLSNIDKHRRLNLFFFSPHNVRIVSHGMKPLINEHLRVPGAGVSAGDEVFRVHVGGTDTDLCADFDPQLTGLIAINESRWEVFSTLDTIGRAIAQILCAFQPSS